MLDPTRLVISALIGLVILLVLIIKFKVQAMIAILIGAVAIGSVAYPPAIAPPTYTMRAFSSCIASAISCRRSLFVFDIAVNSYC